MKKEQRLNHAKHNEEICKIINDQSNYQDWVITTAFYSALHYVSYQIFPISHKTTDGKMFSIKTLDEYYSFHSLSCGKHHALADLVYANIPSIHPDYKWLMDICLTARYKNYIQGTPFAERAMKLLETIKLALGLS